MKFKKHISILLAFVVFMANISYSFTVHYCGDAIASISLSSNFEEPCSEPIVSCCASEDSHDSCCSDSVISLEKKSDNFLTKSLKFDTNIAVLNAINTAKFADKNVLFSDVENSSFYYESNGPPIYKLNCQLVFYA